MAESVSPDRSEGYNIIEEASPDEVDELLSHFTDYDYALYRVLDGGFDYIRQISAVRDLLHRQKTAEQLLEDKLTNISESVKKTIGIINEMRAIDEWNDHFYASVYQDAAHSMAAVGMLAALIESVFYQSFAGFRQLFDKRTIAIKSSHPRWGQQSTKKWDYHFFWDGTKWKKKGFAKGILQLVETVGLSAHMPNDLEPVLQALFEYRNKMFHCGFEWHPLERKRFAEKRANWPSDWFSMAARGEEPWIFYLTEAFSEYCLDIIDSVLSGIGAFARIRSS